ncbi:hypothetical protein CIB84_008252 [Bambusicola thoracicus]|uniref:Uncharacterized protein n=1 Tax=Bambusicola thoracicus TaxID=9083 RepID=A0A2P4SV70_BAMTH|nr:hypothetical protein CIB84_008252 [Bambusicola thoracicus]
MQNHHSRRLDEEGEDISATKDPKARLEPRSRNSISCLSAASRQREAENTKSKRNDKELVAGQQQTPDCKMPGSLWKTTKASCKNAKKTNESLTSTAPDMKAEWEMPLEKKNSLTRYNRKNKFVSADELSSNEEVLRKDVLRLLYGILKDV